MIDVLLATYNGGKYLPELLESLDRQSFTDWRLIAGDDGSTDDTVALLEAWGRRNPGKLRWREGGTGLGACRNFAALMEVSDAPYFMFCDQDDVWLPEKMAMLLERMQAAEETYGRQTPIVVHSDLIVTDEKLNTISESFWRGQRLLWPDFEKPWKTLVLQNVVTGCAMIGNSALRDASLPIAPNAMMHDWWIALTAAAFGRVVPLEAATVLYRQHGTNAIGFRSWAVFDQLRRLALRPIQEYRRVVSVLSRTRGQARAFIEVNGRTLEPGIFEYISDYGHMEDMGLLSRKRFPFRHRLWFGDPIRNFGLVILI